MIKSMPYILVKSDSRFFGENINDILEKISYTSCVSCGDHYIYFDNQEDFQDALKSLEGHTILCSQRHPIHRCLTVCIKNGYSIDDLQKYFPFGYRITGHGINHYWDKPKFGCTYDLNIVDYIDPQQHSSKFTLFTHCYLEGRQEIVEGKLVLTDGRILRGLSDIPDDQKFRSALRIHDSKFINDNQELVRNMLKQKPEYIRLICKYGEHSNIAYFYQTIRDIMAYDGPTVLYNLDNVMFDGMLADIEAYDWFGSVLKEVMLVMGRGLKYQGKFDMMNDRAYIWTQYDGLRTIHHVLYDGEFDTDDELEDYKKWISETISLDKGDIVRNHTHFVVTGEAREFTF